MGSDSIHCTLHSSDAAADEDAERARSIASSIACDCSTDGAPLQATRRSSCLLGEQTQPQHRHNSATSRRACRVPNRICQKAPKGAPVYCLELDRDGPRQGPERRSRALTCVSLSRRALPEVSRAYRGGKLTIAVFLRSTPHRLAKAYAPEEASRWLERQR